jgi:spermidine synthase
MASHDLMPTARAGSFDPAQLRIRWGVLAPFLIVFFGGANLILVQWVLVREVTTLLLGTELVILLISVTYFIGVSVGYLLSGKVSRRWLVPLGVATFILHLTLPVTFRLLVTWLGMQGAYWAAFLILPLTIPFVVSAFYSIFLPLYADQGRGSVGELYFVEVLGTIFGVASLVALSDIGFEAVFSLYITGLILILLGLGISWRWGALLAVLGAVWLAIFPSVNRWSNNLWYVEFMGFPEGSDVIFSAYSPYQKVDVIELPGGERGLYLDGLSHFNGAFGHRLNTIVGSVPASLIQPQTALVIGAGVMKTEQLLALGGTVVTTVEIDPVVADVGARLFYQYNQMDVLTDRVVVVDDAKHYIANTSASYDLIVADTPAALSIQPATLYSVPFYQSIRDRLTENGLFVGNMMSQFIPGDVISRRVAASVLAVFDEVIVVTPMSVGWSFIFAADELPFTRADLEAALRANGEIQFTVFDTIAVRAIVADAAPITLDSMDLVLHTSWEWVWERLTWDGE